MHLAIARQCGDCSKTQHCAFSWPRSALLSGSPDPGACHLEVNREFGGIEGREGLWELMGVAWPKGERTMLDKKVLSVAVEVGLMGLLVADQGKLVTDFSLNQGHATCRDRQDRGRGVLRSTHVRDWHAIWPLSRQANQGSQARIEKSGAVEHA